MEKSRVTIKMEKHIGKNNVFFRFFLNTDLPGVTIKVIMDNLVYPVTLSFKGNYSLFLKEITGNLVIDGINPNYLSHYDFIDYDTEFKNNLTKWIKQNIITDEIEEYQNLYNINEIDFDQNELYLYKNLKGIPSNQLRTSFQKLEVIAKLAYLKQDKELFKLLTERLIYLTDNHYNVHTTYIHNWWDYEIGIPKSFLVILSLYNFEENSEFILKCLDIIYSFSPNPLKNWTKRIGYNPIPATGANVMDLLEVTLWRLLLTQQKLEISKTVGILTPILKTVDHGDGFYEDGSFIQHGNIAYTGSYGEVLLSQMAKLLSIYHQFAIDISEVLELLYPIIMNAYAPIMYKGYVLDNSRGRGISREGFNDNVIGKRLYQAVAKISRLSPKKYQLVYETILNDKLKCPKLTAFQAMKRYIFRQTDSLIALSLSSKDIITYEQMNGENLNGWYYGLGFISFYLGSKSPYTYGYYPTINPYFLPGVTNTLKPLDRSVLGVPVNSNIQSGLIVKDVILIGFHLVGPYDNVEGFLTYLLYKDGLIGIGSNINSQSGYPVVSTIFNESTHDFIKYEVDDLSVKIYKETGFVKYHYPKETIVSEETRSGAYKDINELGTERVITRKFLKGYLNHGTNCSNSDYQYAMVVNTEELPNYTILKQDDTHIIKMDDLTLVNHFSFNHVTTSLLTISSPCQLVFTSEGLGYLVIPKEQKTFIIETKLKLTFKTEYTITHNDGNNYYEINNNNEKTIEFTIKKD